MIPDPFSELIGEPSAAPGLEIPLTITEFPNVGASSKIERRLTLRDLADRISGQTGASKGDLPLLKLATYGDQRTDKGSLRHHENMTSVAGLEGDYDAGAMSIAEAAERLRRHDLAGLIYATPSSTPDAPRWRVLVPLSRDLPAEERDALAERLHGAFDGQLEEGSTFDRSKAFFYGRVRGQAPVEVQLVDGRPIDEAPELADIARPRERSSSKQAADYAGPIEPPDWPRIREALTVIPPYAEQGDSYGEWLTVAQALHHVSGGSDQGLAVFMEWSRGWDGFKERECRQKWRSFREARRGLPVTVASLFKVAQSYGYEPHPGLSDAELDEWIADLPDLAANDDGTCPTSRLRLLTPSECAVSERPAYIIKGLIARGNLACIFGAPGAGKSFLGPHLGYAVARGAAAFGRRTKQGAVLYVAAEDPAGMRGRIDALLRTYGEATDFLLVEGVSDLLSKDSADLKALRRVVRDRQPSLIFIDTVALAFQGLQENDAADMGRVVAIGRKLGEHGAGVVLIHHDTKAEGQTPRGHSVLNGALDVAMYVKRDADSTVVRVALTKNRNGSSIVDIAFAIDPQVLGEDEDGDPVTSAIVREFEPGEVPKPEKMTPAKVALSILDRLADSGGLEGGSEWVSEADWREACINSRAVTAAEKPKDRARIVRRIIQALAADGDIICQDGRVRRFRDQDGADAFDDLPE